MDTRSCGSFEGSEFRWQDLLQHLEDVGADTRSCGSFQGLKFRWQDLLQHLEDVGMATDFVEAASDYGAGCRTCYSTWRKLRW